MADDTRVAELASLLEIDIEEARSALAEAAGDLAVAVEVVRTRASTAESLQSEPLAATLPQERRYEWAPVGSSVLTVDFQHRVEGEPPLLDRNGVCELRALERGVPPRDFLPVLCEALRAREVALGAARGGALGFTFPDARTRTTTSLGDISLASWPSLHPSGFAHGGEPQVGPKSREALILEGSARLAQRLAQCGLRAMEIPDDGNCLFRACAVQLYRGDAGRHHLLVRHRAVAEMSQSAERYREFFGSEEEFRGYLTSMAAPGTWGDELVLRAIADSYGATLHVLTSSEENWYIVYSPESCGPHSHVGSQCHIFLTYLSPIHYNGFEEKPLEPGDVTLHLEQSRG